MPHILHSIFTILSCVLCLDTVICFHKPLTFEEQPVLFVDGIISDLAFNTDGINDLLNVKLRRKRSPDDEFQDFTLALINQHRKKHRVPPLVMADDMNTKAQSASAEMATSGSLSSSCKRTPSCPYTENSAISHKSSILSAINMTIDSWYNQNSNYDFKTGKPINSLMIKEFTTMVWKSAKKIGVGVSVGEENQYFYIVVFFSPRTNIPGQFTSNVFPASDDVNEIEENILSTTPQTTTTEPTTPLMSTTEPTTPLMSTTTEPATPWTSTTTEAEPTTPLTTTTTTSKPTTKPKKTTTTTLKPTTTHKLTTKTPTTTTTTTPAPTPTVQFDRSKTSLSDAIAGLLHVVSHNLDDILQTGDRWQIRVLNRINELRAKHRSPPLVLDENMTQRAQKWSEKLAAKGKLAPSCDGTCNYGENIGEGPRNKNMSNGVNFLVEYWYKRLTGYDYATGKGHGTGAFTQLVWKGSKKVGIGGAVGPAEAIFAVIQFEPPGNTIGSYRTNVQDPDKPSAYELAGDPPPTNATLERKKQVFQCASKDPCGHGSPDAGTFTEFQKAGLDAINKLRKKHGTDPLCLDENLNTNSMDWAESQAAMGHLDLSCIENDCCYGEIEASRPPNVNDNTTEEVLTAIQKWYDESKDYDYKTGLSKIKTKMVTGFSALVWKGSRKLGIGAFVRQSDEVVYVVLEFFPPGNTRYQYVANVMPVSS